MFDSGAAGFTNVKEMQDLLSSRPVKLLPQITSERRPSRFNFQSCHKERTACVVSSSAYGSAQAGKTTKRNNSLRCLYITVGPVAISWCWRGTRRQLSLASSWSALRVTTRQNKPKNNGIHLLKFNGRKI